MKQRFSFLGPLTAVFAVSLVSPVWASPIVTFDASTVTLVPPYGAGTNYASIQRSADVNTTSQIRWNFDTTASLFSSITNPLQSSQGAVFYGGINEVDTGTTLSSGTVRLHNNNPSAWPNKAMVFSQAIDTSGGANACYYNAIYVWKKEDFSGLSPGQDVVQFDSTSTLNMGVQDWFGYGSQPIDIRFVVENGGQYYLSEAKVTSANTALGLTDFNNNSLAGKRWAAFTPTATSFGLPTSPVYTAVNFNDVQQVGIIGQGGERYARLYGFNTFSATANLVPEPGTLALLAFGSLAVMKVRRKKHSS